VNTNRLAYLDDIFGSRITPIYSDPAQVAKYVRDADLVIGGVLIPGAQGAQAGQRETDSEMQERQPWWWTWPSTRAAASRPAIPPPTTTPPTRLHGVVHYCVATCPARFAQTSTFALTNATIGYGLKLATWACRGRQTRPGPALGVNTFNGHCTYKAVAEAHDLQYTPLDKALPTRR